MLVAIRARAACAAILCSPLFFTPANEAQLGSTELGAVQGRLHDYLPLDEHELRRRNSCRTTGECRTMGDLGKLVQTLHDPLMASMAADAITASADTICVAIIQAGILPVVKACGAAVTKDQTLSAACGQIIAAIPGDAFCDALLDCPRWSDVAAAFFIPHIKHSTPAFASEPFGFSAMA